MVRELGREIYHLLFEPNLELPVKTLDLPVAGQGYGPHVLPFLFDLLNLINEVAIPDSSNKRVNKEEELPEDADGSVTLRYLTNTRSILWRLCSNHASSLGLHPALYFYSPRGVFQPTALLSFVSMFKDWNTQNFVDFTHIRANFEKFLLAHRGITEAVRKLGSGGRSRPRVIALYRAMIADFRAGRSPDEVYEALVNNSEFSFLFSEPLELGSASAEPGRKFTREIKGAAFLRDALPPASKCPTCGGILHHNSMNAGHQRHRRDGGTGELSNAMMQHPFCNSTVEQ